MHLSYNGSFHAVGIKFETNEALQEAATLRGGVGEKLSFSVLNSFLLQREITPHYLRESMRLKENYPSLHMCYVFVLVILSIKKDMIRAICWTVLQREVIIIILIIININLSHMKLPFLNVKHS